MKAIIDTTLQVCARIDHERTISSVFEHLRSEVVELEQEIAKYLADQEPGKDGIEGEAVDVMLCALDIIFQKRPGISADYIASIAIDKLQKWQNKYGKNADDDLPVIVADELVV